MKKTRYVLTFEEFGLLENVNPTSRDEYQNQLVSNAYKKAMADVKEGILLTEEDAIKYLKKKLNTTKINKTKLRYYASEWHHYGFEYNKAYFYKKYALDEIKSENITNSNEILYGWYRKKEYIKSGSSYKYIGNVIGLWKGRSDALNKPDKLVPLNIEQYEYAQKFKNKSIRDEQNFDGYAIT